MLSPGEQWMPAGPAEITFDFLDIGDNDGESVFLHAVSFPAAPGPETPRVALYLFQYLRELGACTMIRESPYCDLESGLHCVRLHFFACPIGELSVQWRPWLFQWPPKDNRREPREGPKDWNYLGFIVVRPTPGTANHAPIGRTIVKRKSEEGRAADEPMALGYRECCAHECVANICGAEFRVRSLAFQEQCGRNASCAAVALWGAFQVSQNHYGTPQVPSPREITLFARGLPPDFPCIAGEDLRSRTSLYLSFDEMKAAVSNFGYHHHAVAIKEGIPLRSLIYAYLKFGFPVVLTVHNGRLSQQEIATAGPGRKAQLETHSILLTDFQTTLAVRNGANDVKESLRLEDPSETSLRLKGRRIENLFAHDDQIGPFCKITLKSNPFWRSGNPVDRHDREIFAHPVALTGTWEDNDRPTPEPAKYIDQYPLAAIPVVGNCIRLGFIDVYAWVYVIDAILTRFLNTPQVALAPDMDPRRRFREWDIYLVRAKEYKRELSRECYDKESHLNGAAFDRLLGACYPSFMWRATFRIDRVCVLEVLFDARIGDPLTCPIWRVRWFDKDVGRWVYSLLTARGPLNDWVEEKFGTSSFQEHFERHTRDEVGYDLEPFLRRHLEELLSKKPPRHATREILDGIITQLEGQAISEILMKRFPEMLASLQGKINESFAVLDQAQVELN